MPRGGLGQRGEVRWSGRWRRQREGLGRLADLGSELLEPGRGVQGEEPRGGGGDDGLQLRLLTALPGPMLSLEGYARPSG